MVISGSIHVSANGIILFLRQSRLPLYVCMYNAQLLRHVRLFETPWTVAHQAPLSMGMLQARVLEWVAMPSSRGSSQPRDWTPVSHIAPVFFTMWASREAHEYWSGQPIPTPEDLPNPGIEPGSPALQAESLSAELPSTPCMCVCVCVYTHHIFFIHSFVSGH